ncbi:MAG: hypothetical protein ACT4PP_16880 [Sporichthyaceae bacterium]
MTGPLGGPPVMPEDKGWCQEQMCELRDYTLICEIEALPEHWEGIAQAWGELADRVCTPSGSTGFAEHWKGEAAAAATASLGRLAAAIREFTGTMSRTALAIDAGAMALRTGIERAKDMDDLGAGDVAKEIITLGFGGKDKGKIAREGYQEMAPRLAGSHDQIASICGAPSGDVGNSSYRTTAFPGDPPVVGAGAQPHPGGAAAATAGMHPSAPASNPALVGSYPPGSPSAPSWPVPAGAGVGSPVNADGTPAGQAPTGAQGPGPQSAGPGGSGPGASAIGGAAAAAGGLGAAALAARRGGGPGIGGSLGSGVLGPAGNAAGVAGVAGAAGARAPGPGMVGGIGAMGGGAGTASSTAAAGPRYGNAPRLAPRDRRRSRPLSAALGAGSRAPDDAQPTPEQQRARRKAAAANDDYDEDQDNQ